MYPPLVGSEFKNKIIDEILDVFGIERSLSMKGCPYDNAVVEDTYKVIKTEFVNNQIFETQEQLGYEFTDYVNGSSRKCEATSSIAREWV